MMSTFLSAASRIPPSAPIGGGMASTAPTSFLRGAKDGTRAIIGADATVVGNMALNSKVDGAEFGVGARKRTTGRLASTCPYLSKRKLARRRIGSYGGRGNGGGGGGVPDC